ncbi:MAG: hypothetical protein OEW62_00345 [Candidatus Bathyarchaeota archaeon]|nr:hypothetical protein [Candidatus Bathyarchaeota archaeon]MDH5745402.1 hypothetical protein [Candidatus Bathyarchaeota archaeon]
MRYKPLSVTYGIGFNTILYPLTFEEIVESLEKKGYEISPALPFPRPPGRMTGTGEIARKGKTVIQVDTSAQFLTIVDISIKSALTCFDEIANILKEDHDVDVNDIARFYSFVATYEFPTKKQAYKTIAKALRFSIFDDLEKIMDEKIWPFGLRFGGADLRVNSENWFDITVRPNFERNDSYVISVVFRNSDRVKTRKFVESFEERMAKVIGLIDR